MRPTIACAAAGALLVLAGCGTGEDAERAEPGSGTHTMSDGTVMSGESHDHGHDHGADGGSTSGPSDAARMVCTGQVVDDVTRIMDLPAEATPSSSWQEPVFTCRFDLEAGPLTLTVHDATDRASGMAHFQTRRTGTAGATPIRGVYSLGLPAYETRRGTVAFVKDGKTLEVDATGLAGDRLGVGRTRSRSEIAYAVATSVLACWTAHG